MANPVISGTWTQWTDIKSGKFYYHNSVSNTVTWEQPPCFGKVTTRPKAFATTVAPTFTVATTAEAQWVWLPSDEHGYVPATLRGVSVNGSYVYRLADGSDMTVAAAELREMQLYPVSRVALWSDFDDLVNLDEISPGTILHQLKKRYMAANIYTAIGSILVSINPYQQLPIYHSELIHGYKSNASNLPPHIFKVAANSYSAIMQDHRNQAVVISGESGSGKTEATKLVLQFLSEVTRSELTVAEEILNSNPVLEAFGNAKTTQNNNSSRFGKWVELFFDNQGRISAAQVINYLLEKSRVVSQAYGERNYHIFYQLCAGLGDDQLRRLNLDRNPATYAFLNQSECYHVENVSDEVEFQKTVAAMKSLAFTDEELEHIWSLLAALLHLGNMPFMEMGDGSTIEDGLALKNAASLMKISTESLSKGLCFRSVTIARETSHIPLRRADAMDARNALVKAIYHKLFEWLVHKVNLVLNRRTSDKLGTIGILDIFGFEIFENNSYEQFLINYANEKLQQHFNSYIFKQEQNEYVAEGVSVSFIDFQDNQPCLDLIEASSKGQLGILGLLDDDSNTTTGSDESFMQKMHNRYGGRGADGHASYDQILRDSAKFVIHHYAGSVTYNSSGFVVKNTDRLHDSLATMICTSEHSLLLRVFEGNNNSGGGGGGGGGGKPLLQGPTRGVAKFGTLSKHNTLRKKKAQTLGGQFKRQLTQLYDQLCSRQPHFVRCIKPNNAKVPEVFEAVRVLRQVQYAGLFEAVRIRQSGFGFRMPHKEFAFKYSLLVKANGNVNTEVEKCQRVIDTVLEERHRENLRIGSTKVFMRNSVRDYLNDLRESVLVSYVIKLQAWIRGTLARRVARALRQCFRDMNVAIKERNSAKVREIVDTVNDLDEKYSTIFIEEVWFVKRGARVLQLWDQEATTMNALKSALEDRTVPVLMNAIDAFEKLDKWRGEHLKSDTLRDQTRELFTQVQSVLANANKKAKAVATLEVALGGKPLVVDELKMAISNAESAELGQEHHLLVSAKRTLKEIEDVSKCIAAVHAAMSDSNLQGVEDALYDLSVVDGSPHCSAQVQDAISKGSSYLRDCCTTFIDQAIRGEHQALCEQWMEYARTHSYDDLVQQCERWLKAFRAQQAAMVKASPSNVSDRTDPQLFDKSVERGRELQALLVAQGYDDDYARNVIRHIDPMSENPMGLAKIFISKHPPVSPAHLLVSVPKQDKPVTDTPRPVETTKVKEEKPSGYKLFGGKRNRVMVSDRLRKELETKLSSPMHQAAMSSDVPPPRPPAPSFAKGLRRSMARSVARSMAHSVVPPPPPNEEASNVTTADVAGDEAPPPSGAQIDSRALLKKRVERETPKPHSENHGFVPRAKMMALGNYVEDLSRYCVFVVMRDQFPLSDYPFLRPIGNYTKGHFFGKKTTLAVSRLKWQKDDLPRSLIRLSTKMCGGAQKSQQVKGRAKLVFVDVCKFMGDRFSNFTESSGLAVVTAGVEEPLLRDEIYCQLIKQTTENTSTKYSLLLGWKLLWLCCSSFVPSDTLYPYVLSHLSTEAHTFEYVSQGNASSLHTVNDLATHCYFALKESLKRSSVAVPSLETITRLCEGDLKPPRINEMYLLELSEHSRVNAVNARSSLSETVPPPPPPAEFEVADEPPCRGHRHQMSWSLSISIPPPPPPEDAQGNVAIEDIDLPPSPRPVVVADKKEPWSPAVGVAKNAMVEEVMNLPAFGTRLRRSSSMSDVRRASVSISLSLPPPPPSEAVRRRSASQSRTPMAARVVSAPPEKPKKKRVIKPPPPAPSKNNKPTMSRAATTQPPSSSKWKNTTSSFARVTPNQKTKTTGAASKMIDEDGVEMPPPP